ncbi:nicotinate-nucleotide adenylyltransferase [Virgibacillus salexigens]|uniref:Probable nicotinate-nucleotide adenylyltransferase n=1 Tax=Virgibacillus kapii TaxID=1638645 RepID=A0ABQ2D701_9BACI|nr:nicotinate-nucleotide adenylyltransferase [Virgibacillus kapii]GGJ48291.1 putative nicotinate-nucleotide adenylyltransferase [Virgibacillus kapii]
MKHIGILGGTFDPPHMGHLIIAEEVRIALQLDEVWFIPSYTPPHKAQTKTSARDRLNMVKRAIQDNPFFKVNTIELERSGKSYTIQTIKDLQEQHTDTTFYFIIGGDMIEYLPKWHRIEELIQLIEFVGVQRPNYSIETPYPITVVDIPLMEISSTFLRDRMRQNRSVHYFLPPSVYNYMKEHQLYEH